MKKSFNPNSQEQKKKYNLKEQRPGGKIKEGVAGRFQPIQRIKGGTWPLTSSYENSKYALQHLAAFSHIATFYI